MDNFMKEFNSVFTNDESIKFPARIHVQDLVKGNEYDISEVVYVKTVVHDQSVVLRIIDENKTLRILFLPEKFADKFRNNFANAADVNCHELYLIFMGFKDEASNKNPCFKIEYKGNAQHPL